MKSVEKIIEELRRKMYVGEKLILLYEMDNDSLNIEDMIKKLEDQFYSEK